MLCCRSVVIVAHTAVTSALSWRTASTLANESPADVARAEQLGRVDDDNYDALVVAMTEICRGCVRRRGACASTPSGGGGDDGGGGGGGDRLANDVVRNGEGVQHVMRVRVTGAESEALAHAVGKSIANSPLIKCAVAADDANVGCVRVCVCVCVCVCCLLYTSPSPRD